MLYKAIVTDKENGKRIFIERDYPTKGDNHRRSRYYERENQIRILPGLPQTPETQ
jgi:hypothetical protein